jgi:hypothetical protein
VFLPPLLLRPKRFKHERRHSGQNKAFYELGSYDLLVLQEKTLPPLNRKISIRGIKASIRKGIKYA